MKRFKQKSKPGELGTIVYEDIDLVIFEKAAGVLSYPLKEDRTISAIQLIRKRWKSQQRQNRNLYLIHRLDQDTSGLMVFAKTTLARRSLAKQFHDHSVIRGYVAVTRGIPNPSQGRIRTMLGRQFSGRRGVTPKGRVSITDYVVRKSSRNNALVYCSLHTGRTHQVRIHMAHLGTPVVGDRVYGKTKANRMMLHAQVLGFHHPRSNTPVVFVSSLPAEFKQAFK
jgi:23S rRNA pseudouridine1911/1915/1917 synthase